MKTTTLLAAFLLIAALNTAAADRTGQIEKHSFGRGFAVQRTLRTTTPAAPRTTNQWALFNAAPEAPEEKPLPFDVEFRVGMGYDTNPDNTHKRNPSWLGRFDLTLEREFNWGSNTLTLDYELNAFKYEGDSDANDEIDHAWSAELKHGFQNGTIASLELSDAYAIVDGSSLLNEVDAIPAISHNWQIPWFRTVMQYEFKRSDYLEAPSRPQRDGDANFHGIGAALVFTPSNIGDDTACPLLKFLRHLPFDEVTLGYQHGWNFADGSDYDYTGDKLLVALSKFPLFTTNLTASLEYSHEWRNFDHSNTGSSTGKKRDDSADAIAADLGYVFARTAHTTWSLFARYKLKHQPSNVQEFDFDQHVTTGGLKVEF